MNPLDALRIRMDDYKSSIAEYLMAGGPKDYETYVKAVAKVEAIEMLLGDIAEIEHIYIED
jgi:hypothetical protein